MHQIAKAQATHDVLALEAQPLQRRLVDHLHHTLRIQRVVATRRLVVQVLCLAQGPAQLGVGGGQFLGAFPHAVLQLGAEALDRFLLLVQIGDVARDGQQHHRAALRVADRRHRGVPPFRRALEGFAKGDEAGVFPLAGGSDRHAGERLSALGPPAGPVAAAHLLEVVNLHQPTALCGHLQYMALQVKHLGAVRAAGDDLAVELVLEARVGFQCAQLGDLLHKAQLAQKMAFGVVHRHIAHRQVHDFAVRSLQPEFNALAPGTRDPLAPARLHPLQVVGVHPALPAQVEEVLRVQTKDAQQGVVHMREQARAVGAENADRKRTGQGCKQRLVFQLVGGRAEGTGLQFAQAQVLGPQDLDLAQKSLLARRTDQIAGRRSLALV